MPIVFPFNPGAQTPVNTFSPTSTPVTNTSNNATYTWNSADRQWVYAGPNVDPSPPIPGTGIQTPSITFPLDGATGVTPLGQLNIQSSPYTHVVGNPGPHESSNWQLVEGQLPLVSTNTITGIVVTPADWTDFIVYNESLSNTYINGCYVLPDGRAMGIASSSAGQSANYRVHFSSDGGHTWTDGSAGPQGVAGGGNFSITTYENTQLWQESACCQLPNGNVFALLRSNRPNFGHGFWHYDYQTDTYRGYSNSNVGSNFYMIRGVTYNNYVAMGYPGSGSFVSDPATATGYISSLYSLPSDTWLFGYDPVKEIYFGQRMLSAQGNNQRPYIGWFIGTDKDDLRTRTEFIDDFLGSAELYGVFYSPPLGDFVLLCSGGIVGRFDTDAMEGSFQNVGTTQSLRHYIWNDPYHIITSQNCDELIFSTNFEEWTVLTHDDDGVFGPLSYDTANNRYYSAYKDFDNIRGIHFPAATQPANKLTCNIAGAQTDGFEVGMEVENRGGLAATGTIFAINDSQVELLPYYGTWTGDGTQKISISPDSYSVVVDSIDDTVNLTTYPVAAKFLEPDSDYRARVQYRSNANVVSDFSLWSSFSTLA